LRMSWMSSAVFLSAGEVSVTVALLPVMIRLKSPEDYTVRLARVIVRR
jgi:hypothetical protein